MNDIEFEPEEDGASQKAHDEVVQAAQSKRRILTPIHEDILPEKLPDSSVTSPTLDVTATIAIDQEDTHLIALSANNNTPTLPRKKSHSIQWSRISSIVSIFLLMAALLIIYLQNL